MNARNQEQVSVFRRYLLERPDRSRSRLVRAQIRCWIEWIDALQERRRNQPKSMKQEIRLRAA